MIENSPLKLFSRAKNAINAIYSGFDAFLLEVYQFLDCKSTVFFYVYIFETIYYFSFLLATELVKSNLISEKDRELLKTYKQNCELLITMISRDRMKVVFFGRTSNGKSTAINAMLGEVKHFFLNQRFTLFFQQNIWNYHSPGELLYCLTRLS